MPKIYANLALFRFTKKNFQQIGYSTHSWLVNCGKPLLKNLSPKIDAQRYTSQYRTSPTHPLKNAPTQMHFL